MLDVVLELFDALPIGVVVMDHDTRVVAYNRYEQVLARRSAADVRGRRFFAEVAPCTDVLRMEEYYLDRIGRDPLHLDLQFEFPFPHWETPRDVLLRLRSFRHEDAAYGILFVEDVSARLSVENTRDALTALLVHDLKNPLSSMTLVLDQLARDDVLRSNPGLLAKLDTARRGAARLSSMILNLLDVNQLETASVPVSATPTELGSLVREVVKDAAPAAARRGLDLRFEPPIGPREATCDRSLVRRALENLVDNAIRHARKRVTVSLKATDDEARFEIRDDGPGVPERLRERIFDKFARAGEPQEQGQHNYGLGLTLVRLVARVHGGMASVETPEEGGSIFQLTIPLVRRAVAHRP